MNEDWRIREYTNQVLLSFAFKARNALVGSLGPVIAEPEPLLTPARVKRWVVPELMQRVSRNPDDFKPLRMQLEAIPRLLQTPDWVKRISESPLWSIGELVQWWLSAGMAVAQWKEARARRDGRPMSQTGVSDGAAKIHRLEDWLWSATVRRLLIDDDEEYPPLWCSEALAPVRAPWPEELDHIPGWDRPGSCREDYLCGLLERWGDLSREALPDTNDASATAAWISNLETRSRDLARMGLRLFGQRCRCVHRSPSPETFRHWRAFSTVQSCHSRSGFIVLRWPLERCAGSEWRHAVSGWTLVPRPAAVVHHLAGATAATSVQRATALPWPAEARSFGSLCPWIDADEANAADLAAVARLALVTELMPKSDLGDPRVQEGDGLDAVARVRLAMLMGGFEPEWRSAADGEERLVPLGPGCGDLLRYDGRRLVLRMRDSEREVDVGVVGPPARCPDDLLAAIEELDWRLWSRSVLGAVGRQTDAQARFVEIAKAYGWESMKRSLLDLDRTDPRILTTLEESIGWLNEFALAMHAEASTAADAAIPCDLAGEIDALLRAAVALVPEAGASLYPPRKPDGRVDLLAWMNEPLGVDQRATGWQVAWERRRASFGTQVSESVGTGGRRAVFSAGAGADDADLRILNLPGLLIGSKPAWDGIRTLLRNRISTDLAEAGSAAVPIAVAALRAACAGDAAASFDVLIRRAISSDDMAVAWVRTLADDPRFAFTCHPGIEISAAGVTIRAATVGDRLEWRDDDRPADTDLEVTFALDPAQARRVLSRGRPSEASAETCTKRLEHALGNGPPDSALAAAKLRQATDLRRMFGMVSPDPLPVALAAVEAIRREAKVLPAERMVAAFRALGDWCVATGARLVPAEWHPTDGSPSDGLDIEEVRFHASVPSGRVHVERFGAVAGDGSVAVSFQGFVSAGSPPIGFTDVADLAAQLFGAGEELERLHRCIADFPKRTLNGKGSLAAKSLFDIAWKAFQTAPADQGLMDLVTAVHKLLERAYGMVLFEPASLHEFPELWLRTVDGSPPHGTWVRRIIRPGVRTRNNDLVWHAIVEMG